MEKLVPMIDIDRILPVREFAQEAADVLIDRFGSVGSMVIASALFAFVIIGAVLVNRCNSNTDISDNDKHLTIKN